MDPNPRKTLRKAINHLDSEMKYIQKRLNRFAKEKERLRSIEANGTIDEVRRTAEHWSTLDWLAEPPM